MGSAGQGSCPFRDALGSAGQVRAVFGQSDFAKKCAVFTNFFGYFFKADFNYDKIFTIYKLKLIRKNNVGNFLQEKWSKYKKSKIAC